MKLTCFLIPSTQKRFPIGGQRVTCHALTISNSLGKQQLEVS